MTSILICISSDNDLMILMNIIYDIYDIYDGLIYVMSNVSV